jgi:hypothetical protein
VSSLCLESFDELGWVLRREAVLARQSQRVLLETLYIAAARRLLKVASEFNALIAKSILSSFGSDSRSGCCDIVRSGRKRYSLGRSGRFAYLGVSLAGYVIEIGSKVVKAIH